MPIATARPSTAPRTPLPAGASKFAASAKASPFSFAAATIAAASGCSLDRSRLAARRSTSSAAKPGARRDRDDARLALGQRAGLVDDQRVDLLQPLQRFGVLDQHARLRAAADADHDRHRRRQPEGARAGDDQHRHRGHKSVGEARLGAERRPGGEGENGDGDDQRHEPARHLIGEPLDRRPAALRLGHHLDDLRQHGVAADAIGAHHEGAGLIDRPADDAVADRLGDRHRFARHHRFVDRAAAFEDFAVDRDFVARAHAQAVADRDALERDVLVVSVRADAASGLGREIEQRANRAAGPFARSEFEDLPEQHQRGDGRRRFEIDRDGAAHAAKGGGK